VTRRAPEPAVRLGGLTVPRVRAKQLQAPGVPHLAKRGALFGVAAGMVVAGAAVGLVAERYAVGHSFRRRSDDPVEPLGQLHGNVVPLAADDGVPLHVEVVEVTVGHRVTIVFCHGLALDGGAWHYQRRDLEDVGRLVFWDQRGHGRSGRGRPERATIDQLGADLLRVLDVAAPEGPVVVVGHSMGGMTLMALADQHPELFGPRIIGVVLMATSPGQLADLTLGVPAAAGRVVRRVLPSALNTVTRWPDLIERSRRATRDVQYVITKRYSFATDVPHWLVQFVVGMHEQTPLDVLAELYPAFDAHDKLEAIGVLNSVETLILAGENDLMTPADHSREMAAALPAAELVVLPRAGHMLMLEHHRVVSDHIRRLVDRAMAARASA
jgi:pimeloyl-ACP methyl ester carboxylesterase